jgi:hypothetical protein
VASQQQVGQQQVGHKQVGQEQIASMKALADRPFFLVHVMKTGGTSLWYHARRLFGDDAVYPNSAIDPIGPYEATMDVNYLLSLPAERIARIRYFHGHFPFFVTDLLAADVITMSVLRHPVDRTVSFLKHWRTLVPSRQHLSLEELYDDPVDRENFAMNHQTQMFSMTPDDNRAHFLELIEVDDRRLETAKANVDRVDILGVHERFGEFLEKAERYGWNFEGMERLLATGNEEVPDALRRRILADNAADLELYEYALDRLRRS